ncbi:MAG: porphobilinogen synthase [Flavobacteriales bacterium]|tara:strand:+ start:2512 stop:3495 length:984 start_codon:yes stop_codon:yes gene_type:complete
MSFPYNRNRRLRKDSSIRAMVQENRLHPSNFIVPLFVMEGQNTKEEISSMPGYFRYTIDLLIEEARECFQLGIKSALIFAKVENDLKDNSGNEALNPDGLMQRSIKALKENVPQMYLMSDVALDPYSEYGHDGIVEDNKIVNDKTIILLADIAVSHAQAGVDMVAPSDMMDGRILAIREALEDNDFVDVGIMSYSVKYASSFYGPFRDALDSSPGFGDKKTYQMDPSNSWEGISEVEQDMEEGADIIMIKPGMPYLDMVRHTRNNFDVTISVYQVSGEYAMIKAASQKGWLNHDEAMMESLIGFKRAGANLIATYFAKEAAKILNNE